MSSKNEIVIDNETYVKKSSIACAPPLKDGLKFQIIRTYSAGVFAGYLESQKSEGGIVNGVARRARRIYSWAGAASLSELSVKGTSKPSECKFPCEVDRVELKNIIEVLDVTEAAKKSIDGVAVWTAHK